MASDLTIKLNTGQEMPLIGLGTWQAPVGQVGAAVETALRAGYKHIDCAACYGNEDEVGAAMKKVFDSGDVKREDVFVTSKLWNSEHAPEDVKPALATTLNDLQLDYIDLYIVHWPHAFQKVAGTTRAFPRDENGNILYNTTTTLMETWTAMEELLKTGLVRAIGVSNFNSQQISEICEKGTVVPATNQVESHPFFSNQKLVDFCAERGIQVTAYSPLGTGATINGHTIALHPELAEIGTKYGKSAAQVAIGWQVARKIPTFPKSVTKERIEANMDVNIPFTNEELAAIAALDVNHRCSWAGPQVERNGKREPRDLHHPLFPFKDVEF